MADRPRYAEGTEVDPRKTRLDIERLVVDRHRCRGYQYRDIPDGSGGAISFEVGGRPVRFLVLNPDPEESRRDASGKARPKGAAGRAHAGEIRRRWRVLLMRLKMKFESIAEESSTAEEEFLPYYVTTRGHRTVGEVLAGELTAMLAPAGATLGLPAPGR